MPRKQLAKLLVGFRRFRQQYFEGENSLYGQLSQSGQSPKTLIIACSDSRVDPAILFSASPGDFFVVRNIANLVPPFERNGGYHGVSSAIEFAVVNLQVQHVIILGHRQCGGIRALMMGVPNPEPSFIANWVSILDDAKERVLKKFSGVDVETQCAHCELEAIRTSVENLRTFPFVSEAIKNRGMNISGAYFNLEEGSLLELNESTGEFAPIEV